MRLEDFHFLLGQTVMYCQIIEHDIKLIYSAMLKGDLYETLDMIEDKRWTLGYAVKKLKELDSSDKNNYISLEDYNYLLQMARKRDHWSHKTYINFIYDPKFTQSSHFDTECKKLCRDNNKLRHLYLSLEKVRMQALKDFGRI